MLSSADDFADMYRERAEFDAILVGAGTIRRDNPSLLLKDANRIADRISSGRSGHPMRVTVTRSGKLNADARFFDGAARSIVLCAPSAKDNLSARVGSNAQIVPLDATEPRAIIAALEGFGIQSLFIEGGTQILTAFLAAGMFHRLRLSIAPFFIGDVQAAKFVNPAKFMNDKEHRLHLMRVRALGDMSVLDFQNSEVGRDIR